MEDEVVKEPKEPIEVRIVDMPDSSNILIRNQMIAYGMGTLFTTAGAVVTDILVNRMKERRLRKKVEAEKAKAEKASETPPKK